MARLSVNLNKIALLRNSRRTGVPDVLEFARLAYEAGAQGITVHPRPDERHIRGSDVPALAELMADWRPACELNIEGYPDERLFAICDAIRPEQCTLVPDGPGVLTSEEGWKLDNRDTPLVNSSVARLKALGARVILFIDPDPGVIDRVPGTGADGVELYTGSYADAFRQGEPDAMRKACAATAARAAESGLVVNAGHDLNLDNLPALVAAMPSLAEASIGHELTADALKMGWQAAVRAYKAALSGA
ncbi:MAG TPA: pyridoxine 5'-phosphate synthase [Stellaceae bacterium]|jgi:pyridoxine 5-phosphate synthase|nr:pyridoxine 5'-phosphate synthase [Stellaceae bacterium]